MGKVRIGGQEDLKRMSCKSGLNRRGEQVLAAFIT